MNNVREQVFWYQMPLVWMLILIPLSSVIMGVVMIWLAISNNDGLVVDDYYKEGKTINKVLRRDIAAAKYGLEAEILFDYGQHKASMKLASKAGFNYPDKLAVHFLHATRTGFDKTDVFIYSGNNLYTAILPELNHGKWYIQIEENDWRLLGSLSVPEDTNLHIRAIE